MAPLTQIQKAVYANQTMAMERESVLRAARVVAKARKELLAKVQAAPKTTSIQQATLSSLDAVLKTLPQDIMKALRTDELVEKGYRQGRSLLLEVAKGTDAEGKLSGFAGILDLRTYSQDANQAVAQIRGLGEQAKAQIKASAELSLALGEGEVDTMKRLFGDIEKPGEKTPFRSLKISAERIARTVTNSLVNSGKSSAYQQYANEFPELGILNEWVNVTDFRTSDTCRALVGQKRPPGQAFQGGGFSGFHPPAHIQCRSTIIPTIGESVEPVPAPTPEPDTAQLRKELATKLRDRGNIFADLATKDGLGEATPEWVDGVDRQNFSIGIRLIQLADQIENDRPFRTTDDSLQFISYLRALQEGNTKTLVEDALRLAKTTPEQDKEIAQWAKPLIEDGIAPQFLIDATNRFRATRNLPPVDGTLPPSTTTPAPLDPEPTQPSEANLDERIEALFGVERDRKLKALYKKASEAKTEAESNKIWEEIEQFEEANPYTGGVDFIEEMERLGNPRDALISDYSSGRYSDYNRPTDHTKQKLLVEVLAEKPKFVGKSYRFSDIVEGATEVGGTITSGDAFLSTSKDRNSRYITDRKGFILEIEGRSGVDVSPYSRFEDEAEILYSPDTEFEVVAKRREGLHTYLTVKEKESSLTTANPEPVGSPEPRKVKAPTFEEYTKSLPKGEQKWLKDYVKKVEDDYWLTANVGNLDAPADLMDKWRAVYAKSAHKLAQTPKVKVISDKDGLKEHQESFEMFGHNVTMTLAKPFDWNAFTGRETNEPPEFPKVSVVFVTDGGFNPKIKDPKEAMAIASEVKKRLNAAMAEMPDGTVMVNEPVGGTLGKRAFIYSMQGWGPCGPDGKQYAVIKGGKAVPLSIRDYEKLQKTGEI